MTIIPEVVQHHADEAATLYAMRKVLLSAPHIDLSQLRAADERLAAHLDGLDVAGEEAWPICEAALESVDSGAVFVAAIRAIQDRRGDAIQQLLALEDADRKVSGGLISACAWLERSQLQGVVVELLKAAEPIRRLVGIAASAAHRVDPGIVAANRLEDHDPFVRARSMRTAGELGLRALVSRLARAMADEDPQCQFWAAWSAALVGDRLDALEFLKAAALADGALQPRAFQLVLSAMPPAEAQTLLSGVAGSAGSMRTLIKGAGFAGDPAFVPWLMGHMSDDKLARLAGESFSMITGLDLTHPPFARLERPANFESGPSEDPEDENVELDEDESLPWPIQEKVQAWWNQHGQRFTTGVRHFMGEPPNRSHCIEVLKNGYQRQRIAAAYHLCLLNPGTPLFEWRAPAWRQQRELEQMKGTAG